MRIGDSIYISGHVYVNRSRYEFNILQYAGDALSIHLTDEAGTNRLYVVPVKQKDGVILEARTKSVLCESGKAEDILKALEKWPSSEYAPMLVRKTCFTRDGKRKKEY